MNEASLRKKIVDIAKGWLGCNEADGSHRKIINIYNSHRPHPRGYRMKYTDDWCAGTVSAVSIKAGTTDIMPVECSCYYMIELYKKLGRWVEDDSYVPKPGDVLFYDWEDKGVGDNKGAPNHVGIVVSVVGNVIKIIEGNKGNAVAYRNIAINGKYIRGYGVPNYAAKVTPQEPLKGTVDPARHFDKAYARTYTVTAGALNLRRGAGTTKGILKVLKRGDKVTCYGYYTKLGTTHWMYVKTTDGTLGYCSKAYLI